MENRNMILYKQNGKPYSSARIKKNIENFGNGYNKSVVEIIKLSANLDRSGEIFSRCVARILSNFKMTRRGPFEGLKLARNGRVLGGKVLKQCWREIGKDILEIKSQVLKSKNSPGRFLLYLSKRDRQMMSQRIWDNAKKLLPYTMGKTTYGLVGASKILFSVLPEIVLPVDTKQWIRVFRTVDLGDVTLRMSNEIELWERDTGEQLDSIDTEYGLTTLPAVYNVMAMGARPK
jgi:hypothetical protein